MLEWKQGQVVGIMTGQTSMVSGGRVSETFTLATDGGTVRCALPFGTYCRLRVHLLNKRVTVFGMVGCEADGQPRKIVDVVAVVEQEGGHDAEPTTKDSAEGVSVATDGSGHPAV